MREVVKGWLESSVHYYSVGINFLRKKKERQKNILKHFYATAWMYNLKIKRHFLSSFNVRGTQPVLWLIGQETARLWEKVTLGLMEIQTADPLPMIPHQAETQFISSRPFPVSVSGLIPSASTALVPCWCGKCPHQVIETQTVPEYPLQLGCQSLTLQDPPRISSLFLTAHQYN